MIAGVFAGAMLAAPARLRRMMTVSRKPYVNARIPLDKCSQHMWTTTATSSSARPLACLPFLETVGCGLAHGI